MTGGKGKIGRPTWKPVALVITGCVAVGCTIAALLLSFGSSGAGAALSSLALVAFVCFALAARPWAAATPRMSSEGAEERAELVSRVSHELRSPLMSVKGLAASGSRLYGSMSDEDRLEFFRLIDAEAIRMEALLEEMTTALRIDAGSVRYQLLDEDLAKLVEETARSSPVGRHTMVVDTEDGLTAQVDRTRFAEALTNLIDNAAKFSPADAQIDVRAYRSSEGRAVVEVVDRGPGIPQEQREAVFRRFCRWRPVGYEAVTGAGLGLSIARAHLRAQGGRLDVEDRPGGGSMLCITLPLEGEQG